MLSPNINCRKHQRLCLFGCFHCLNKPVLLNPGLSGVLVSPEREQSLDQVSCLTFFTRQLYPMIWDQTFFPTIHDLRLTPPLTTHCSPFTAAFSGILSHLATNWPPALWEMGDKWKDFHPFLIPHPWSRSYAALSLSTTLSCGSEAVTRGNKDCNSLILLLPICDFPFTISPSAKLSLMTTFLIPIM